MGRPAQFGFWFGVAEIYPGAGGADAAQRATREKRAKRAKADAGTRAPVLVKLKAPRLLNDPVDGIGNPYL